MGASGTFSLTHSKPQRLRSNWPGRSHARPQTRARRGAASKRHVSESSAVSVRKVTDNASALASDLRRERVNQGLTLDALSKKTGISVSNIRRLEGDGDGRVLTLRGMLDALEARAGGLPDRSRANDLPARLKLARAKAALTVSELAARAGVSREAVQRLEGGGGNVSTLLVIMTSLGRRLSVRGVRARVWAPAVGDRDTRYTPASILNPLIKIYGPVELDPCWGENCLVHPEREFTVEDDGLAHPWVGDFIFCNPPFSQAARWAAKCRAEYTSGRALCIVALLKCVSYGSTFHDIGRSADIVFLPTAVAFLDGEGRKLGSGRSNFGTMLLLWGASEEQVASTVQAFEARVLRREV